MNKINEVAEILKTDAEEDLVSYGSICSRQILKNAIMGFSLSCFISVILVFFHKAFSPLVKMEIGLFTEVIVLFSFVSLAILLAISLLINLKPNFWLFTTEKKSLKYYYRLASIYDFINFIISAFLCVYIILLFVVTPTTVIGKSMENTYKEGDKILIWHVLYEPSRNDCVVIDAQKYSGGNEEVFFIKRIVGVPNDKVKLISEGLLINDEVINLENRFDAIKNYLDNCEIQDGYYIIPEGKYLVLGDNRAHSSDSRMYGLIDETQILGKSVFRAWPLNKLGFM